MRRTFKRPAIAVLTPAKLNEQKLSVVMFSDNEVSVTAIIACKNDLSGSGRDDILLQLLVNKSAESLEGFDPVSLKSTFFICMGYLSSSSKKNLPLIDLSLSLLCNLTATEVNSQVFLDLYMEKDSLGLMIPSRDFKNILERFLNYDSQLMENPEEVISNTGANSADPEDTSIENRAIITETWDVRDPWQHMSSIICNITRIECGRQILLRQSTPYMKNLLKQIRSKNSVRRRGAVASIRTCLFDNEIHWWMIHELGVLSYIMLPLVVATPLTDLEKAGMNPILWLSSENPNKMWEPEIDILIMLLECIVLLCQKRGIRDELRKRKVYPLCRNLDYLQEDEGASNIILEIVNFLMREEDPNAQPESENQNAVPAATTQSNSNKMHLLLDSVGVDNGNDTEITLNIDDLNVD